jgi:hypothetical protein
MSTTPSASPSATSSADVVSVSESLGMEPSNSFPVPFPNRSVKKLSPSSSLRPETWRRYASDIFMTETYPPSFEGIRHVFAVSIASWLSYMASSLYLAYLPFDGLKRLMGRFPILFTWLSHFVRALISMLAFIHRSDIKLTASLIKFNCVREGYYSKTNEQIVLHFFEDKHDVIIAEEAIKKNMDFLESVGTKPPFLIRRII